MMQSDDDDETYADGKPRRVKRRKTSAGKPAANRVTRASTSLSTLLDAFQHGMVIPHEIDENDHALAESEGFESTMDGLLPECLEAREDAWAQSSGIALPNDNAGEQEIVRPLTRFEVARILSLAKQRVISLSEWIVLRKLQLQQERRRVGMRELRIDVPSTVTPLEVPPTVPIPQAVSDGLRAIQTTQYESSFAARLYGHRPQETPGLIAVDWESRPPWALLMDDVCAHYALAHPERDQPERPCTPITYVSLQPWHLRQVHDLLTRAFWEGIDVSDALRHAPERCTVIATYGHLVVGAAFLSSPQETYITYLAVRAGWENAQIATTLLHHLIALHPYRDITLHVSANNPAMLLYNRFGFKAEEFIAGFYEAYLDAQSRVSKNAFRLRLRR